LFINNKLHLVIGEDISEEVPSLFSDIMLYTKDENEYPQNLFNRAFTTKKTDIKTLKIK